jgi:hypothetical protein
MGETHVKSRSAATMTVEELIAILSAVENKELEINLLLSREGIIQAKDIEIAAVNPVSNDFIIA